MCTYDLSKAVCYFKWASPKIYLDSRILGTYVRSRTYEFGHSQCAFFFRYLNCLKKVKIPVDSCNITRHFNHILTKQQVIQSTIQPDVTYSTEVTSKWKMRRPPPLPPLILYF